MILLLFYHSRDLSIPYFLLCESINSIPPGPTGLSPLPYPRLLIFYSLVVGVVLDPDFASRLLD